tara:strand:+ start:304 stop:513 length:210 start_codon:yes stop_codon:yes gene_type:complete
MNGKIVLMIGLVLAVILIAGCSSKSQYAPPPTGAPIGGGCGVAPAPVAEDTVEEVHDYLDGMLVDETTF